MTTTRHTLARRLIGAAGALTLALIGVSAGSAARAADGNIDDQEPRTLTIHKYAGLQGDQGDGTEQTIDTSTHEPLEGVEFTVTPVTGLGADAIDLATYAGWDLIDGVTVEDVLDTTKGYTFGTPTTVTTDEFGEAELTTLPIGLYLVQETGHGANPIVSEAAPFLVTLPLPQGEGSWLYDVHVYPKNQLLDEPTKTVADPAAPVLGSSVTWTISATVPAINEEDALSKFVVTDTLDPRLTYTSLSVTGFEEGTDYAIAVSGQTVTVTFTETGLGKLEAGQTVSVSLVTTVTSQGDGTIENTALVNVNDQESETDEPSSNWGVLDILKHAQGDESATLAGAVFAVYAADPASTPAPTPVATLTTGADGTASIVLFVGNDDDVEQQYWLVETDAPAGYILDETPIPVTVTAGESAEAAYKIPNPQQDHPNLPLTGANGELLMTIGGAALLLLGGGAYLVTRRRSSDRA
ncbi:SpaH/EbpB family LPXTG-anchored major pilin [Schaalia naturae]|uniref:SpaH/EbpB family LPXTG-anchored major pilin n=1 Tax=Schaalia naturae TaxID=635203 RepID=A0ABW2SML0_9ACTO